MVARDVLPSLEGRFFSAVARAETGDVSAETVFEYHQIGELVWARYRGGAVRLGFLVGRREGDRLEFRYSHLDAGGETAGGVCSSVISADDDGLLVLAETWQWESKPGAGTSILRELT